MFYSRALREHRHCLRKCRLHIFAPSSMAKHWHIVYLWSVCHLQVAAFNLDTHNVLQRSGDPGSLFGFSVAFHQQLNPARKNLWVKTIIISVWVNGIKLCVLLHQVLIFFPLRLLVGAPQAKGQVNVTGVVYQCDLTTKSERCQPIEFDNEGLLAYFIWNYLSHRCIYLYYFNVYFSFFLCYFIILIQYILLGSIVLYSLRTLKGTAPSPKSYIFSTFFCFYSYWQQECWNDVRWLTISIE